VSGPPNLFIVGAPKCGTTALTRYLEAHPEVFVADRKDLHQFGADLPFQGRTREPRDAYLARFAGAGGRPIRAESSVWYLSSAAAPAEMRAASPGCRAVALLRHPTDAMYALWAQLRLNGLGDEDLDDFEAALAAEPDRAAGRRLPPGTPLPTALLYRRNVRFASQLQRYIDVFGRESVYVLIQEEMNRDTAGALAGLFAWLGVDPGVAVPTAPVNTAKEVRSEGLRRLLRQIPGAWKDAIPGPLRAALRRTLRRANARHAPRPPLAPALRARLDAELAPEVAAVEALLGRPVPAWSAELRAARAAPRGGPGSSGS
jgi:hypothetical protein